MSEHKNTPSPSEKLESSQAHAKKALEVTAAAAREVAEAAKTTDNRSLRPQQPE